ncbi:hypothetical protein niasHS_018115 [Heterodera schachtii]|uniref:Uncharacterized protein n=1 Tax=Heterodera schachtii TaxID=97005 RepID=A0ABD2HX78_HETSC
MSKIEEKFGISSEEQTLRQNNPYAIVLDPRKRMEDYGIQKGHTIYVSSDEFYITVNHNNDLCRVWVSSTDTGIIVKEKIKAAFEHANDRDCGTIMLKCARGGVSDSGTMAQLGIKNGSFVFMECQKV